jgi:hypothetical protein
MAGFMCFTLTWISGPASFPAARTGPAPSGAPAGAADFPAPHLEQERVTSARAMILTFNKMFKIFFTPVDEIIYINFPKFQTAKM